MDKSLLEAIEPFLFVEHDIDINGPSALPVYVNKTDILRLRDVANEIKTAQQEDSNNG